jgi:ribosome biogenesis GTPase
MQKGVVTKSTGSWYSVKSQNKIVLCRIKGKFRIKGITTTNPIAVGDIVHFELNQEDNTGNITKIEERKNYIIRKSTNLSHEAHIIAANIDQAFLIVTLARPETSVGFIDRFLITAEAYHIPVHIVFNKIDIYDNEILQKLEHYIAVYEKIGYKCHKTSALEQIGIDEIKAIMDNKVSLLSGHSGVGKSTIVNRIDPFLNLKTAEVSDFHNKGVHTTTFAEMYDLVFGGSIIDTPGIKGFGTVDMPIEDVSHYFPEIFKVSENCKFNNCTHIHEPGCAVKEAVKHDDIAEIRYNSYVNIITDTNDKYRQVKY